MANGNSLLILQSLRREGQITRRALANELNVGMSMVSRLTSELESRGLICEAGRSESLGGRPSDLLSLEPSAAFAIGLDIGGNHRRALLANLVGDVVAFLENDNDLPTTRKGILQDIGELVGQLLSTAKVDVKRVFGLGAGLWGSVDPKAGVVYSWTETPALYSTWKNFALREALREQFDFPYLWVDDVVRTMGIAEVLYGGCATLDRSVLSARSASAGRDEDFIFALADTGVGVAVMIDGVPYIGPNQLAGEIGHIPIPGGTLRCSCGSIGCLETVASSRAVVEQTHHWLAESAVETNLREKESCLLVEDVILAAESGDKLAYQIMTDAGEKFGMGLAIAANMLGPRLIVVGGALAASRVYLDAARRIVRMQALGKVTSDLTIEASRLDHLAGARGAASHVLNMLFLPGEKNLLSLVTG
jgi:predicted NBD/HSP70 family sugar kinase